MAEAYFGDRPAPYRQIVIPLSDGTRLAARLWLPETTSTVPVVLEWIPYRQSDGTAVGDSMVHGFFALNGIAAARIDIRGSGNSDGLLVDEYTRQEQIDACEVIAWFAAQRWCNGNVGMIGISWGGFAGLQVAACRPPALKAVITCCSTDDRYRDDVHFMGGALLADGLQWGSGLLLQLGRPPDPAHVGDRWKGMWQHRLDNLSPPLENWLAHMKRDDFWRHGSICEDYGAIQCPVYAVSGWTDGYSDAVLRMMQHLDVPRKGLIGPWTHMYPTWGKPGPGIGFLQECLRWWRHWLLGEDTGIMAEPMLRLWRGCDLRPQPRDLDLGGTWFTLPRWPCEGPSNFLYCDRGRLSPERGLLEAPPVSIETPQSLGFSGGEWCPLDGGGDGPEFQADNRGDDALSLRFDGETLDADLDVVGTVRLTLELALAEATATLVVRLNEVTPEGRSARVTFGVQRIRRPAGVAAGEAFPCEIALKGVAYRFATGNRLRLALSTSYWPMAWPERHRSGLEIRPGSAVLMLPAMPPDALHDVEPFEPPLSAMPMPSELLEGGTVMRTVSWNAADGAMELLSATRRPLRRIDGLTLGGSGSHHYRILPDDGASSSATFQSDQTFERPGWSVRLSVRSRVSWCDGAIRLESHYEAQENGQMVFARDWDRSFPY